MIARLTASGYFAGWAVVRALPEPLAYALFNLLADIFYRRNGKSVKRLRQNLTRVSSESSAAEIDSLVKAGMRSYLRYWCDTFRIQNWSKERIQSSVTVSNSNLLIDPMKHEKGVVVALPHSGNWDHAGAYFCSLGIPLVTVAEHLKPEALFQRFLEHRARMGFEVLTLDTRSFGTLMQRARDKRLIALVADRDLSRSGITVDFFGAPAKMPAGPALLAIRTGIPLIVAHVSYTLSGIHIEFNSVDVPATGSEDEKVMVVVQKCADLFASGIKAHPADWHMLQRIWIDGDFAERQVA
jgi:phosphatidylinositol dimannoside acyltransferase